MSGRRVDWTLVRGAGERGATLGSCFGRLFGTSLGSCAGFLVGSIALSSGCSQPPAQPKAVRTQTERDVDKAPPERAAADAEVAEPTVPEDGVRAEVASDRGICRRTLCIAGEGPLDQSPNRDLGELCRRAGGTVRRCEGERCTSTWTEEDWTIGYDAMIASLDGNGDGKVDDADPACTIHAAGWSGGAVVAAQDLADRLRGENRLAEDRRAIESLVLIAPYAEGLDQLTIRDLVRKAFVYRFTKAPPDDCTLEREGGPWLSPPPVCGESTQCWDYDYSYEPELAFLGRKGARAGSEIGHCTIVPVVTKIAAENLTFGIEAYAELLPRLSDGSESGRKHRHGADPREPEESLGRAP